MNRWMSNSLPNLFNKSTQGASKGHSDKGTNKRAPIKLDLAHAQLFNYLANVEANYAGLCNQMDAYHLENARLRDCGDELSLLLAQLGKLSAGPTAKKQLEVIAKQLAFVEDHRNAEVLRLKAKVLDPLASYGNKFKLIRSEMNKLAKVASRQSKAKSRLDRMQMKGTADSAAKMEATKHSLQDATFEIANRRRTIDTTMLEFEKMRTTDLQVWLREFIQIEMLFHAKVLNAYNSAWQSVRAMNTEEDLLEFRKAYLPADPPVAAQQAAAPAPVVGRITAGASVSSTGVLEYTDDETEDEEEDYDDEEENDYEEEDITTASASRQSSSFNAGQPTLAKRSIV